MNALPQHSLVTRTKAEDPARRAGHGRFQRLPLWDDRYLNSSCRILPTALELPPARLANSFRQLHHSRFVVGSVPPLFQLVNADGHFAIQSGKLARFEGVRLNPPVEQFHLLLRLKPFGGGLDFFQRAHTSKLSHHRGGCPAGDQAIVFYSLPLLLHFRRHLQPQPIQPDEARRIVLVIRLGRVGFHGSDGRVIEADG